MGNIKSEGGWTACTCPKCGVEHNLRMFWTGTTTPLKFCKTCKAVANGVPDEVTHTTNPSRRSRSYAGKKELYF